MAKKKWTLDQMPEQAGRIAVVTGANSGLGFYTSQALALKGAKVIMACRNLEKGEMARQSIMHGGAGADPEVWQLDLASLESVMQFALKFRSSGMRLDLLINNAGLMAIPYARTAEGFEMQFGVNHLGHFVLSAQLWPILTGTAGSRLVQVASIAHRFGKINFEDIHWEKGYKKWKAYGMSKLANLLFIRELAKRLDVNGSGVTVAAAHPGWAATELQAKGARIKGSQLGAASMNLINKLLAQPGDRGALPSLYAATAGDVEQGDYFGPDGWMRMRGWPKQDKPSSKLLDDQVSGRLWEVSESLTGVEFRPWE